MEISASRQTIRFSRDSTAERGALSAPFCCCSSEGAPTRAEPATPSKVLPAQLRDPQIALDPVERCKVNQKVRRALLQMVS